MMKVEAVVVRDRVETVMEAVEAATGHVGVTVIEAVGHGREKGITHEYRGRVFESRFLPKALMTFVVRDEIAEARDRSRSSTPRAQATQPGTASAGPRRSTTSPTTGPERSSRRWRRFEHQGAHNRGEHDLGRRRCGPRHLHAGGLRVPRGRPDPDEERRPYRGQERADPCDRVDRLLPRRVRARVRRRRQRASSAARDSSRRSTSCCRSGGAVLVVQRYPGARPATCSRSCSRPSRWQSSGARWRSAQSCGCTSPSERCSR